MASVLVVEDDRAMSEIMCQALRDEGFSVECVQHDRDAYTRIARLPTLDAVVPDVNLGAGTTGYDVARFARQMISDVVVYVSGEVVPASFAAFGVPNSTFIAKPFRPDELVDAVTKKLGTCLG